jgi:hypothetical protein
MQLLRAMTDPSWSQPGAVDYNRDGRTDAPGDLNGDGVVDFGGTRNGQPTPIYVWGESLGGLTAMMLGALDPAITAVAPVSGGAGLTDVAVRTTVTGVLGQVITPTLGPMIVAIPARDRPPVASGGTTRTQTACTAGEVSLRWVVQNVGDLGELEFACEPLGSGLVPGDDVLVYNAINNATRCARVPADGRLFVPIPADLGDAVTVTVLNGHAITDFGTCARAEGSLVRTQIRSFEVGEGDCDETCGHIPRGTTLSDSVTRYARRAALVAPASGLGFRRQTSAVRRFLQLAQAAIDPGDPVNFAPLFMHPARGGAVRPVLAMTTVGDTDVPIAAGNTWARAAGLLPFLRDPTGTALDEHVAPQARLDLYHATPDDVLLQNYVIEGLSRLARFPNASNPRYLFDPDDLDEGRQPFGEVNLDPPMRLVRAARAVRAETPAALADLGAAPGQISDAWRPRTGEPLASFINAYVEPTGVHTFFPSNPDLPWDAGNYLGNLIARFFQTGGTDVEYFTNPTGHQCLEDSSCAFIPRTPPP